jgi:hypothetical protein
MDWMIKYVTGVVVESSLAPLQCFPFIEFEESLLCDVDSKTARGVECLQAFKKAEDVCLLTSPAAVSCQLATRSRRFGDAPCRCVQDFNSKYRMKSETLPTIGFFDSTGVFATDCFEATFPPKPADWKLWPYARRPFLISDPG